MSVVAIVLAAGLGSRFGSDKRQARLSNSHTLLSQSVERALAAFDEVRVVLRDGERAGDFALPAGCRIIHSPQALLGMGHSLAAGALSLHDSDACAAAVLLGDMPWIGVQTLEQLKQHATATSITFPRYQGKRGHPVFFGRAFWPELTQLSGDDGARAVLQAHQAQCVIVDVDDAGVLRDVDTPNAIA